MLCQLGILLIFKIVIIFRKKVKWPTYGMFIGTFFLNHFPKLEHIFWKHPVQYTNQILHLNRVLVSTSSSYRYKFILSWSSTRECLGTYSGSSLATYSNESRILYPLSQGVPMKRRSMRSANGHKSGVLN